MLVVARGPGYKSDLRMVRPYIRDFRPVLVAVDGGADALREVGLAADMIVGDFDSVTDGALQSGAELVVHGYPGGGAPGAERLRRLGLEFHTVFAPGISGGSRPPAGVREGRDADRRRGDALQPRRVPRAGSRRDGVDVRHAAQGGGVPRRREGRLRLVSRRVGIWPLAVFAATGVAAIVGAVLASPALRNVLESMGRAIGNGLGL